MLKKSLALDDTYAPAYAELGKRMRYLTIYDLGEPAQINQAEKYLLKALSLNDRELDALASLTLLFTETGESVKAMELTQRMLEINPNYAGAHFSLGYIYRYAGMLEQSIKAMELALTIDPGNRHFRSLGVTYFNSGQFEKAWQAFDIDKNSAFSLGWQGKVQGRLGKNKQAIALFERVSAMEPGGFWDLVATAEKAIIENQRQTGLQAMLKLEQSNVFDAEPLYYWAANYAMLGDIQSSLRLLKMAVDGGYFNYPFMLSDSFLDPIRAEPDFKTILESARKKHLAFKAKL